MHLEGFEMNSRFIIPMASKSTLNTSLKIFVHMMPRFHIMLANICYTWHLPKIYAMQAIEM